MCISDWSSDVCSSDLARRHASVGRIGDRRPTDDRALGDAGQSGRRPHRIDRILEALLQPRVGIALDPLGLPELIIGIPLPTRPEIPLQPEERVPDRIFRSEEHTSELQSLMRISYAVFCLKKKKI